MLKLNQEQAQVLSSKLRNTHSAAMRRRRAAVGLSMLGTAALGVVALYQIGVLKHLPEPNVPGLDADKVDASPDAYEWMSTPDAALGMASNTATAALASMGGPDRAKTQRHISLLFGAKVMLDAINAGRLTVKQWTKHRAFCTWCLIAAGATFATVPLAVAEVVEAFRKS